MFRTTFDTGSAWTGWHVHIRQPNDPRGRKLHAGIILDPTRERGPCLVLLLPLKPGRFCTPDRTWSLFTVRLVIPLPSLRWRARPSRLRLGLYKSLHRFWHRLDGRYGDRGKRLHRWNTSRTA